MTGLGHARGGFELFDGCRFGVHDVCDVQRYRPESGTWWCTCTCHHEIDWQGRGDVMRRLAL